jgi:hypothetical protein
LFDPREEIWIWRDVVTRASINFESLKPMLCPAMLRSFKLVMLWMVENRATGGVNTDFDRLRTFCRFVRASRRSPIIKIAGADILNYRAAHRHEGTLRGVRPILRKWSLMGLSGVSDAVALLESIRTKDSVKGRAVRTHDPKMGPFTSIEFDGLISTLNQSVAGGSMDASYAVLAYILIGLGIRPAQCALPKACDITCESNVVDCGTSYASRRSSSVIAKRDRSSGSVFYRNHSARPCMPTRSECARTSSTSSMIRFQPRSSLLASQDATSCQVMNTTLSR